MPRLPEKGSPSSEAGTIHFFLLLILLLGIVAGVWLVQHPTIFKPKADYKQDPSQAVFVNGKQCKDNICETESSNIKVTIDVSGLNSQ